MFRTAATTMMTRIAYPLHDNNVFLLKFLVSQRMDHIFSDKFLVAFHCNNISASTKTTENISIKLSHKAILMGSQITHVVLMTAHGTELLRISCVTQHMYRFSLAISDFLSSGSFTSVNLTLIKSFALNGLPDTGQ